MPLRLFVFGCCLAYGVSPDNARDIALEAGVKFGSRSIDAHSDDAIVRWLAERLGTIYEERNGDA